MKNETLEAVNSACMYFQHDFGLLSPVEQEKIRHLAKEWFHAWEKVEQDLSKRPERPERPQVRFLAENSTDVDLEKIKSQPPKPPPCRDFREDSDIPESERNPCSGLMGKLFGHKYEHIYDDHVSAAHGNVKSYNNVEEILEKYRNKDKVYVCSICKRCGHVIKNERKIL